MGADTFLTRARVWGTLLAALVLLPLSAWPAGAHDDEGVLGLVETVTTDSTTELRVELRYSGDNHPATDATVTVAGDGPGGAALPPVVLEHTDVPGVYAGEVGLPKPGEWALRFSALDPLAVLTHTEVVEHAGTVEDTTTTAAPSPQDIAQPTPRYGAATEKPAPPTEDDAHAEDAAPAPDEEDITQVASTTGPTTTAGGAVTLLLVAGVVVLLLGAAVALMHSRRTRD